MHQEWMPPKTQPGLGSHVATPSVNANYRSTSRAHTAAHTRALVDTRSNPSRSRSDRPGTALVTSAFMSLVGEREPGRRPGVHAPDDQRVRSNHPNHHVL